MHSLYNFANKFFDLIVRIVTIFQLVFLFSRLYGLAPDTISTQSGLQIIGQDTFYVASITPVYIYAPKVFTESEKWEFAKYNRLVRNVKKVYPYAKIAAAKFKEVNAALAQMHSKKEQEVYIDSAEQYMRNRFEGELKRLTINQGKILIKLFYRETGNTTYEVVKELRGPFEAFFWQSLARLFGSSLKVKYDPTGDDADIEQIIQMIEAGMI